MKPEGFTYIPGYEGTHSIDIKDPAGSSGFRGVKFRPTLITKPFRAKINFHYTQIVSAYFETAEEAACEYDRIALKLFGPLATTNESMGLL